jgi:hypothetical protein
MTERSRWYPILAHAAVLWEESGQNLAIFCYLIGWGTFALLWSQNLALIPIPVRHNSNTWNRSFTFSTSYIVRKDSES